MGGQEDIRANPIDRITAEGVRHADGRLVEADGIVFATGFDARPCLRSHDLGAKTAIRDFVNTA